jgi:transcription antitermination protein NusB
MSFESSDKGSGTRHKAREAALQMLFAHDLVKTPSDVLTKGYWDELGDTTLDTPTREFADTLVKGTINNLAAIDDCIRNRAEHWRIERMAIVDRNVLRLAVFEINFHDTPDPVAINEALELARKFSSFEATQFINGLLDAIKHDAENHSRPDAAQANSTTAK